MSEKADDWDAPVNLHGHGSRILERSILEDVVITGQGIREPLVIEPTDEKGVYTVPNGILTTRFVRLSEVNDDTGHQTPPIDWC